MEARALAYTQAEAERQAMIAQEEAVLWEQVRHEGQLRGSRVCVCVCVLVGKGEYALAYTCAEAARQAMIAQKVAVLWGQCNGVAGERGSGRGHRSIRPSANRWSSVRRGMCALFPHRSILTRSGC